MILRDFQRSRGAFAVCGPDDGLLPSVAQSATLPAESTALLRAAELAAGRCSRWGIARSDAAFALWEHSTTQARDDEYLERTTKEASLREARAFTESADALRWLRGEVAVGDWGRTRRSAETVFSRASEAARAIAVSRAIGSLRGGLSFAMIEEKLGDAAASAAAFENDMQWRDFIKAL